ncbi:hypothetical protein D9757_007151 [Collybiopsis confluens]|uniref:N-acetyltransferase domain-containing protein n=1 Tax=Collybiopsis confluens TaxID=2823264 RepID=A0A8H5M4M6_9AGAR|nr:hypothetical protein D9757_007151 [Collybiopsis confluens]
MHVKQIDAEQTLILRHQVLWPEFPIAAVKLPQDENGWHFGAFVEAPPAMNDPIAVISLFLDPIPIDNTLANSEQNKTTHLPIPVPSTAAAVRFRKFACKESMQGQGVGTALLNYTMNFAHSHLNAHVFWCDARVSSMQWYKKRGLAQFGNRFFKGAVEYVRMKKDLSAIGPWFLTKAVFLSVHAQSAIIVFMDL